MGLHLSTFSLGGGTWLTANVVQRELVRPGDEHRLVFTDTLYEDADAYRFGLQGALQIFGRKANWIPAAEDFPDYRVGPDVAIEDYAGNPAWRSFLAELRDHAATAIPELVWLVEGRDPWEVYRDERFLGNSRLDPCSKFIKRETLDTWVSANCDPAETVIYFGIGTGEKHRFEAWDEKRQKLTGIKPRWAAKGWTVAAPLIDRVEGDTNPTWYMRNAGIEPSRNYGLGYQHDNCGGNCSKAGMAHWKHRREVQPDRYAYDAMMEGKVARFLGKNVAFMTDRTGGKRRPITLEAFAKRLDRNPNTPIPEPLPGERGCACMTEEAA